MDQEQLNILEFLRIIRKRKRVFFFVCIPAVAVAIATSLLMTKIYRADAVICYSENTEKSKMSILASLPDAFSSFSMSASSEIGEIMKFLESKSMAEAVIKNKNLLKVFFEDEKPLLASLLPFLNKTKPPTMWDGIRYMETHLDVEYDSKTNTIEISFEFKDPEVATEIVQEYIDVLNQRLKAKTISDAENVIKALRKELLNTEDVYLKEKIYQMLASQIQDITFAASKEYLNFAVIDPPRVPDKRIKPKRKIIVVITFMGSLMISLFLVLLLEHIERLKGNEPHSHQAD